MQTARTVAVIFALALLVSLNVVTLMAWRDASDRNDEWRSFAQEAGKVLLAIKAQGASPEWEYRIDGFDDETIEKRLDEAGAVGWSPASCRRAISGEGALSHGAYECIMQRRKLAL